MTSIREQIAHQQRKKFLLYCDAVGKVGIESVGSPAKLAPPIRLLSEQLPKVCVFSAH